MAFCERVHPGICVWVLEAKNRIGFATSFIGLDCFQALGAFQEVKIVETPGGFDASDSV